MCYFNAPHIGWAKPHSLLYPFSKYGYFLEYPSLQRHLVHSIMFPFSHPIPLFSLHPPFPFINLVKSLRVPTRLHCSHPLFSTCTMASIALTPFFLFIFIGFHCCSCASFATFAYDFIVLAMPPFFLLSTKFFFFFI